MITRVGWTQPPSSHPPVGQGAGAAAGADQLPLVRQGRQKRSQWANGPAPEITTPPKESNGARGTLPGRGKGRGQRPCVPPSEELRAGRTVGGFPAWMQTGLLLLGPNSGWHDHSPPPPEASTSSSASSTVVLQVLTQRCSAALRARAGVTTTCTCAAAGGCGHSTGGRGCTCLTCVHRRCACARQRRGAQAQKAGRG